MTPDILARILADTSDTRDFQKLYSCGKLNDTPTFSPRPREDVGVGVVECQL